MGIGKFHIPLMAGGTNTVTSDWVAPSDWIDISTVANNEINLLMGDFGVPSIAFAVTTSSGTYSIDWGDGTVETGRTSATTYQHNYTVGAGQACSLGYTTFKIRIYGASGNITFFQMKAHDITTNAQYWSLLWAVFGTTALTRLDNAFYANPSLGFASNMQCLILPSALNSMTLMSMMCYNNYALQKVVMPTSMNALQDLSYAFYTCYKLPSLILPNILDNVTDISSMCQNNYSLKSITMPTSMAGAITTLANAFSACYNLQSIIYPSILNSITTMASCHISNYSLRSCTLPTSMNALTILTSTFSGCAELKELIFPVNLNLVTNATSIFASCYNLQTITNIGTLGKTTSGGCDFTTAFTFAERITSLSLGAFISKAGFIGASGKLNKLNSLRLTNPNSSFSGSTPQIDVQYTSIDVTNMETLFDDIPKGLTGKSINITGSTATITNPIIIKATSGTTSGSLTVTQTVTSSLTVGMEVYGTGLSTTRAVTLTDSGDTVNLTAHGIPNGQLIGFATIVTTTGITIGTPYYVVNRTTDTFQVSLTSGGSAIALTTNGSGTIIVVPKIVTINTNVSVVLDIPASATGSITMTAGTMKRSKALLKNWVVTG